MNKVLVSNQQPPQWGAPAARYVGMVKGGLETNQLYRVVRLSNDGKQLTVKNSCGRKQTAPVSDFKNPHDKKPSI